MSIIYIYICVSMYLCIYVSIYLSIYLCMYVCMYACMHVCMHVCMYACMHVCMYACMHVCMYACMHVCMYACMHVCMYACMHVCMYACMHVCIISTNTYMYIIYIHILYRYICNDACVTGIILYARDLPRSPPSHSPSRSVPAESPATSRPQIFGIQGSPWLRRLRWRRCPEDRRMTRDDPGRMGKGFYGFNRMDLDS